MVDECAVSDLPDLSKGNASTSCVVFGPSHAMLSRAGDFRGILEMFPEKDSLLLICDCRDREAVVELTVSPEERSAALSDSIKKC